MRIRLVFCKAGSMAGIPGVDAENVGAVEIFDPAEATKARAKPRPAAIKEYFDIRFPRS